MRYLLDTCVISELVSRTPDEHVVKWLDNLDPETLYLSVITIGEIHKGIEKLPASKRKTSLHEWLNDELLIRFQGRIILVDIAVILLWGELIARLELKGKKMAALDSLIAASALHENLNLITRNVDDFQYADVPIINPWKD